MSDPLQRFAQWFADVKARASDDFDPHAMALATATRMGAPSVRIVLLKAFDERGFVFYTNMESRKSLELRDNPQAALCFHWPAQQVRITGVAEPVMDSEADAYFDSRPLESRIAAMASSQSRPLDTRATLMRKVEELTKKYPADNPPPRPAVWSGWRVVAQSIEFWQQGAHRLHVREVYTRTGDGWSMQLLYP